MASGQLAATQSTGIGCQEHPGHFHPQETCFLHHSDLTLPQLPPYLQNGLVVLWFAFLSGFKILEGNQGDTPGTYRDKPGMLLCAGADPSKQTESETRHQESVQNHLVGCRQTAGQVLALWDPHEPTAGDWLPDSPFSTCSDLCYQGTLAHAPRTWDSGEPLAWLAPVPAPKEE